MGGGEKFAPQLRDTLTREIRPSFAPNLADAGTQG